MKTLRIYSLFSLLLAIAALTIPTISFAQKTKSETFNVSGECGMCKKKIEKAAKEAGASYAVWNLQTKVLNVTYNASNTSASIIQQKIASVGYDTPQHKSTDEAYNALDECCQYAREIKKESCCGSKCEMSAHGVLRAGPGGKDGKCVDQASCKDKACCGGSDACKDMSMGCCKKTGK